MLSEMQVDYDAPCPDTMLLMLSIYKQGGSVAKWYRLERRIWNP